MEMYQFITLIGLLSAGFAWIIMWLKGIDSKINDLDKRIIVIETILRMKECCMIQDERQLKKAE